MNFEKRITGSEPTATSSTEWDYAATRRSKLPLIIGILIALAALLAAWWAFGRKPATDTAAPATTAASSKGATATKQGAAPAGKRGAGESPLVTVQAPGRQTVERVISATGALAARREMPVGVAGEGGQVVRVLVEPGQWVRQGQVLATVDRAVQTAQASQIEAQIRAAQADARLAQSELDRAAALVSRGFVSKADMDRKTATRDAAQARVRVAQAQLTEMRARTGRLDIRAPAAGLVLTRGVEPGQVISAGSGVLFRIARGGEMELLAKLSEGDLAAVNTGSRAAVTPVGQTNSYSGQVWQVAPVIDPTTRQGTARIALSYAQGLRPGGFAEARIVAGAAQVPLLPESAVLHDVDGSYVYVVGADNKVERRGVETGPITDQGLPILAGLSGTEDVVLTAGAFLNPGDVVRPSRVTSGTASGK